MSTDVYSHAVAGRRSQESAHAQLQAFGRQVLAAIMPAMRHFYRAMEETNRRRAEHILRQHPSLLEDISRHKAGRG